MPGLGAHYARRTQRLDGWFRHISFALGGEAGSRLLRDLGVVVSGDTTLLNHIRSLQLEDHETPRVLSVDDFAFRKEISEQGYPGAYQNVWRITRYLKEQERLAIPVPDRPPGILANHAAVILVKRPEKRSVRSGG